MNRWGKKGLLAATVAGAGAGLFALVYYVKTDLFPADALVTAFVNIYIGLVLGLSVGAFVWGFPREKHAPAAPAEESEVVAAPDPVQPDLKERITALQEEIDSLEVLVAQAQGQVVFYGHKVRETMQMGWGDLTAEMQSEANQWSILRTQRQRRRVEAFEELKALKEAEASGTSA